MPDLTDRFTGQSICPYCSGGGGGGVCVCVCGCVCGVGDGGGAGCWYHNSQKALQILLSPLSPLLPLMNEWKVFSGEYNTIDNEAPQIPDSKDLRIEID